MATQVIDLTPEQESYLNTPQSTEPVFDSPRAAVAQALYGIGLTKKALRHDDCKRFTRRDRCAKGHTQIVISSCGIAICLECATEAAKERLLFLSPIALAMAKALPDHKVTFVELHIPCAPDPDSVREVTNRAIRSYLSILPPSPVLGSKLEAYDEKSFVDTTLLKSNAGFNDKGEMILRLLGVEESHPANGIHADIKAAFPEATHSVVSTVPIDLFQKFLKYFLAVAIPKSPQAAANMEQAFTRFRRFGVIGRLHVEIPESEIIVQDTPSDTNNSGESSAENTSEGESKHKKCRICNSPIVSSEVIYLSDALKTPHRH